MQSVYKQETLKIKEKLDSFSPTICIAKWLWVSLNLPAGLTQSCYHPKAHKIPLEELKNNITALHNTSIKKEMRKMMLEGQRPSECSYCWKIEDLKGQHLSDRYYRSGERWARDMLDYITSKDYDYNFNPTYVEVNFNQACNFKCCYCSPHLSTEWEKEIKEFGKYELLNSNSHNDLKGLKRTGIMPTKNSDNEYVKAFWEWWPTLYKNLKTFRMTGGEPLIDHNTFKILDYILKYPKKDLQLSMTTNLCPPTPKVWDRFVGKIKDMINFEWTVVCFKKNDKHYIVNKNFYKLDDLKHNGLYSYSNISIDEIKKEGIFFENENKWYNNSFNDERIYIHKYKSQVIDHFMLFVSLDSVEEQIEYSRFGANYNTILKNIREFLKPKMFISLTFINTFNILSISKLKKYLQLILNLRKEFNVDRQKIWFDLPILESPLWLCINNCSDKEKEVIKNCIEFMKTNIEGNFDRKHIGFKDYEIDKLKRNLEWIDDNSIIESKQNVNFANLYLYFKEYDKRRNTNFVKTFPELKYMYNQGKQIIKDKK